MPSSVTVQRVNVSKDLFCSGCYRSTRELVVFDLGKLRFDLCIPCYLELRQAERAMLTAPFNPIPEVPPCSAAKLSSSAPSGAEPVDYDEEMERFEDDLKEWEDQQVFLDDQIDRFIEDQYMDEEDGG